MIQNRKVLPRGEHRDLAPSLVQQYERPMNIRSSSIRILMFVLALLIVALHAHAAVLIRNLTVEYRKTPIGIDVAQPHFGWQMSTTKGERGFEQTAYRLEVKDPKGNAAWDTQKTESAGSPGIR